MIFAILATVLLKIQVFIDVTQFRPYISAGLSKEHVLLIIRAKPTGRHSSGSQRTRVPINTAVRLDREHHDVLRMYY